MKAEIIGQRIRRERQAKALTQRTLAEMVGVGIAHVSKVETGRESPSNDLVDRFGKALGVDPDELMIVARRLPAELAEQLAFHPAQWLELLRQRTHITEDSL